MEKPERATYTPLDFISWREAQSLEIVPKFQRRGVWSTQARSYFIDTILRGMPVPPIYLRVTQSSDKKRIVREVIDGQQRISAVLDYMDGKYALSTTLNAGYRGKWFSELREREQDAIRQFGFTSEVLHGVSDNEIITVFARLNTYSVPLNLQELRNGTYFGFFKQTAYDLAHEHLEFWRRHRIFTERSIARMLEVELTSELMAAELNGMQDKKKSLNHFYATYDQKFRERKSIENRFRATIDHIDEALTDLLRRSDFRRPPLFYTLFCTVYHRLFGLPTPPLPAREKRLGESERRSLRSAVADLSEVISTARQGNPIPEIYSKFVLACQRQTDNLQPRITRFKVLYRKAFGH